MSLCQPNSTSTAADAAGLVAVTAFSALAVNHVSRPAEVSGEQPAAEQAASTKLLEAKLPTPLACMVIRGCYCQPISSFKP